MRTVDAYSATEQAAFCPSRATNCFSCLVTALGTRSAIRSWARRWTRRQSCTASKSVMLCTSMSGVEPVVGNGAAMLSDASSKVRGASRSERAGLQTDQQALPDSRSFAFLQKILGPIACSSLVWGAYMVQQCTDKSCWMAP